MHLERVAVIVEDYDRAIEFFVGALGFELVEDSPATTNDGRPKRWVVVRPPGTRTGLLLGAPTVRSRPARSAASSPGGSASSSGWRTSPRPTRA